MKRLSAVLLLLLLLTMAEPSLAFDLGGLYVAPKFTWAQQNQDDTKRHDNYNPGPSWLPYQSEKKSRSDQTFGGALAVGYDFAPALGVPVRAELEYAMHARARTSSRDVNGYGISFDQTRKMDVSTLFANVFYDINTGTKFTPYVGGGLGMAMIQVKDSFAGVGGYSGVQASSSKSLTNFAWNLSAGVAYSFDAHWKLDLGYRYSDFGQVKGSTGQFAGAYSFQAKSGATAHEVLLGARYTF